MQHKVIPTPNFIGIGAAKAATSWLFTVLDKHTEVWLPPLKELHYFNRKEDTSHLSQILFRKKDYLLSRNRWRSSSKKPTWWNWKYFCKKRSHQYYNQLFSPNENQICGEITPAYSLLSKIKIGEVKELNPELKIIYILRNPIERDWSQLCMTSKNARNLDVNQLSPQAIKKEYEDKFHKQSNYVQNLENWESVFNKEKIFIGFYDQIKNEPTTFLNNLFDFLQISKSSSALNKDMLTQKVNASSQVMKPGIKQFLIQKEYENILKVNEKFDNTYTNKWLDEAIKYRQL